MRRVLLVLVVVGVSLVAYAGAPGTDLGQVSHGGVAYLPPGPNGFLDVLYMTDEFDHGILENGVATSPSYGWVSADDFVLDEDFEIEAITCWVIDYQHPSGHYSRFWNDTGGGGPGSELDNAPSEFVLTSTGEYEWGYLLYQCDITMDAAYEIEAGHYWWASYFSSGFWYMLCRSNAYDYMVYFDYGGGGSGPWYSSQAQWGSAYDFFQIIEGSSGWYPGDPPYVTDMDPDDGDTGVPVDTDIVFHCVDDMHAVDIDTIIFTVEDQSRKLGDGALWADLSSLSMYGNPRPAGEISGTLDIDDSDPLDVICTFTPDENLPVDLITCTVAAGLADSKGWEMADDFVWTFSTGNYDVEQKSWGAVKAEF